MTIDQSSNVRSYRSNAEREGVANGTLDDDHILGHLERRETKMMDQSRIHLCSSVVVAEVQALKSEVELLKRSFNEEIEARKTGDALSGEAVLQLQAVIDVGTRQHAAGVEKLEGEFQASFNSLYKEVQVVKETLARPTPPPVQTRDLNFDIKMIHAEVEKEVKKHAQQLCSEEKLNQLNVELSNKITSEQLQRQMEDQAMHQLLSTLAEQTNIAFEEESGRVWEALQTHNHDVLLEAGSSLGGIKVNTMTKPSGLPTQSMLTNAQAPRKITLNTKSLVPGLNSQQALGLTNSQQAVPTQTIKLNSSPSMQPIEGLATGVIQPLGNQLESQQPPQHTFNNNVYMESFSNNLRSRIRLPGYNDLQSSQRGSQLGGSQRGGSQRGGSQRG